MRAGRLDHRVRLERRGEVGDDGYGNVLQAWAEIGSRWAGWRPEFGREAVAAGRVEARRAGTLTLRRDSLTMTLTAADRVVFTAGPEAGTIGQIRSVIPADRATIEATVEIGVAD